MHYIGYIHYIPILCKCRQIMVANEEREAARGNEEILFGQLNERTVDLEKLQESYVDMTDRYNDAQDEIVELRDQLITYRDTLNDHVTLHSKINSNNHISIDNDKNKNKNKHHDSTDQQADVHRPFPQSANPVSSQSKSELRESDMQTNASVDTIHPMPIPNPTPFSMEDSGEKAENRDTESAHASVASYNESSHDGKRYDDDFDDYDDEFYDQEE